MSTPKHVFIDTCIFEALAFNFEASHLATLAKGAAEHGVTLLLPEPTRLEVERHVKTRAREAHSALMDVRKKHPFIRKWVTFPATDKHALREELVDLAMKQWSAFLAGMKHFLLGYEGIDLAAVMKLYDEGKAPFGTGKKRKEFPDAFAVAALQHFCTTKGATVAIISTDGDMKAACTAESPFQLFEAIPDYFSKLVEEKDARASQAEELADDVKQRLTSWLNDHFPELWFSVEDEVDDDVSDVEVVAAEIWPLDVVDINDKSFDVTFSANVRYTAHVRIPDHDSALGDSESGYHPWRHLVGTVEGEEYVSGSATVRVDPSWEIVEEIVNAGLDSNQVVVTNKPTEYDDDHDDHDDRDDRDDE